MFRILRRPEAPGTSQVLAVWNQRFVPEFNTWKQNENEQRTQSDSEPNKDPIFSRNSGYKTTLNLDGEETERVGRNKDSDMQTCGVPNIPEAESFYILLLCWRDHRLCDELLQAANDTGINDHKCMVALGCPTMPATNSRIQIPGCLSSESAQIAWPSASQEFWLCNLTN